MLGSNSNWVTDISGGTESKPADIAHAQDRILKEIGSYSMPEVSVDPSGNTRYTFPDLEREKQAVAAYRAAVHPESIGNTVFDSDN